MVDAMRTQVVGRVSRVKTPCVVKHAKTYLVLAPPSFKEHLSSAFGQESSGCHHRIGSNTPMYRPDLVDDGQRIGIVPAVVFPCTGFRCRQQDVGIPENGEVIILALGHARIEGPLADARSRLAPGRRSQLVYIRSERDGGAVGVAGITRSVLFITAVQQRLAIRAELRTDEEVAEAFVQSAGNAVAVTVRRYHYSLVAGVLGGIEIRIIKFLGAGKPIPRLCIHVRRVLV